MVHRAWHTVEMEHFRMAAAPQPVGDKQVGFAPTQGLVAGS